MLQYQLYCYKAVSKEMLWNKHKNAYYSQIKSPNHNNKNNFLKTLVPLLHAPIQPQQVQANNLAKFIVRKPSKSKYNKQTGRGTFYLHKGNNHPIIKTILQQMGYHETVNKEVSNFIWYQGKEGFKRDLLRKQLNFKRSNYLPNHHEITNKQKLFENIARYNPSAVGTLIPKTYIVDFKDSIAKIQANLTQFLTQYFRKAGYTKPPKKMNSLCISNYYGEFIVPFVKIFKNLNEGKTNQEIEEIKPQRSNVLWIVKPSFLNRGQGIQIMRNLKQLQTILSEDSQQISIRMYQPQQANVPNAYVIQQYIMDPLLYQGFKFDIRVWILLRSSKTNGLQVYIYKQAYARLAGHKYSSSQQIQNKQQHNESSKQMGNSQQAKVKETKKSKTKSVLANDKFVHLTNNAVQKYCKEYGTIHQGNQLLLTDLVSKLGNPKLTQQYLYQQFQKGLITLINSCKDKLASKASYGSFQLMGLDFMVDTKLNVWLIQANCNPCLQQSSTILKQILPKMLRQMFETAKIDKIMTIREEKQGDDLANKQNNWHRVM